jgi:hypothetical protein
MCCINHVVRGKQDFLPPNPFHSLAQHHIAIHAAIAGILKTSSLLVFFEHIVEFVYGEVCDLRYSGLGPVVLVVILVMKFLCRILLDPNDRPIS